MVSSGLSVDCVTKGKNKSDPCCPQQYQGNSSGSALGSQTQPEISSLLYISIGLLLSLKTLSSLIGLSISRLANYKLRDSREFMFVSGWVFNYFCHLLSDLQCKYTGMLTLHFACWRHQIASKHIFAQINHFLNMLGPVCKNIFIQISTNADEMKL